MSIAAWSGMLYGMQRTSVYLATDRCPLSWSPINPSESASTIVSDRSAPQSQVLGVVGSIASTPSLRIPDPALNSWSSLELVPPSDQYLRIRHFDPSLFRVRELLSGKSAEYSTHRSILPDPDRDRLRLVHRFYTPRSFYSSVDGGMMSWDVRPVSVYSPSGELVKPYHYDSFLQGAQLVCVKFTLNYDCSLPSGEETGFRAEIDTISIRQPAALDVIELSSIDPLYGTHSYEHVYGSNLVGGGGGSANVTDDEDAETIYLEA